MPVRSSTLSVLRWPDAAAVLAAVRAWTDRQATARPTLVRLGVFGSYARGDAGVGSDLDLIAIVRDAAEPFERRAAGWDVTGLPVPAEVLVYTEAEWDALQGRGARFAAVVEAEALWILG
jgi:hypothetical protein